MEERNGLPCQQKWVARGNKMEAGTGKWETKVVAKILAFFSNVAGEHKIVAMRWNKVKTKKTFCSKR